MPDKTKQPRRPIYQIELDRLAEYRGRDLIVRTADPAALVVNIGDDDFASLAYVKLAPLPSETGVLSDWAPGLPIELELTDPANEFANLYRHTGLLDNHPVRVAVAVVPGFEKAVKLAQSLHYAVILRPGQPTADLSAALKRVLEDYLHRPTVTQPVEFFHSLLIGLIQGEPVNLWSIAEEDPAVVRLIDEKGRVRLPGRLVGVEAVSEPATFVQSWCDRLIAEGAECAGCPFLSVCRGYFKWPDPAYACAGIKPLLATIHQAADELREDLAAAHEARGTQP